MAQAVPGRLSYPLPARVRITLPAPAPALQRFLSVCALIACVVSCVRCVRCVSRFPWVPCGTSRRGEASVLSELSNLSASAAEHLRLESLMEGETLEKLEKDRTYLRYLAVRRHLHHHPLHILQLSPTLHLTHTRVVPCVVCVRWCACVCG